MANNKRNEVGMVDSTGTIDYTNLTPQQRFAFDFGFLDSPFFIASLLMLVVGIVLWFTDKNE